jgi:hypothetical protein
MRFADRDVFALCQDEALARRLEAALQGEGPVGDVASLEALPFPILKQEASPRFVGMLFAFLFARMELRCIEAEAASTLSLEPEPLAKRPWKGWLRSRTRPGPCSAQIDELERQLDEEASVMRSLKTMKSAG